MTTYFTDGILNMTKITKQKAREAFDSLFTNHYDNETKWYEENYIYKEIHPEDISIEDLEKCDYKNLRVLDKYFNPNYWKEENNE